MSTGDIDGDGLDDALITARAASFEGVWVLRQLPDGDFATALIGRHGLSVLHDLDGDGTAEMIVPSPDGIVLLGMGQPVAPQSTAPSAGGSVADQLAAIGLQRAAAEAYEDLGDGMRAGAMWTEAGDPDRAARAYLDARDHGAGPEALRAALEAQIQAHDFSAALETATELEEPTELDLARLANAPVVVHDFDAALDDQWQVHHPMGLAWDRTNGTLRTELMTWSGEVLTQPLEWDGEHLVLDVRMVMERGEWGASPRIALVSPGDDALVKRRFAIGTQTAGGGGLWERRAGCMGPGVVEGLQVVDQVRRGDKPWEMSMSGWTTSEA